MTLGFRLANVTEPIVSAEGLFQAGCTTVISKTGVITPSGQAITLHRRQRTFWLKGRIGTCGEVEVLTMAAVRQSPEVQWLPIVAQEPGEERAPKASESFNPPASPVPETQPEMQENRADPELLRETDGDMLEVSTETVAAKARGIPVMPTAAQAGGSPVSQLVHALCDRSGT